MRNINTALFSYFGNKDNEIETISKNIPNMDQIDVIIEPYCGSFALVRKLLLIYPDKKYVCNDNDELLIKTYKAIQDDKQFEELIEFYKSFEIQNKEHYDIFKKENSIRSFLFIHIIYRVRYGLYDKDKHKFNDRDFNRLIHFNKNYKNIEFICGDAKNIIEQYKNNSRAFMFLDPPFLLTCSFYKMPMLDYFFDMMKDVNNCKSKILAVCGDHFLVIYFFKYYNIKTKISTKMNYRGRKNNTHDNFYVSNY